jgi:hypothetical protein
MSGDPNNTIVFCGKYHCRPLSLSFSIAIAARHVLILLIRCDPGGIDASCTEQVIYQAFQGFGQIASVRVPSGLGCAFITYQQKQQAAAAIQVCVCVCVCVCV